MKEFRLNSVQKVELIKEEVIKTFISIYSTKKDENIAYEKSKNLLDKLVQKYDVIDQRLIQGLNGELVYFSREFDDQKLSPEMAVGYKGDFRGLIRNRPSIVDVTTGTGPYFKETSNFGEVKGKLLNGWDYYVALVDPYKKDTNLYPLLLPRCEDDNLGFFILVFDTNIPSSINLSGELSDLQYLVRYNPLNGGDTSDVTKIIESYQFIESKPLDHIKDIRSEFLEYRLEDDLDEELKILLDKSINDYLLEVAYDYRKITGVMISGLVQSDEEWIRKDEPIVDSRLVWSHPHSYIRDRLGKPGEWMDYDIAGYISDL